MNLNKFFEKENIILLMYSEKTTKKGYIPNHDKNNLVLVIGFQVEEKNDGYKIAKYFLSIKNPKDEHKYKIAKYNIYKKYKEDKPDGIVILDRNFNVKHHSAVLLIATNIINDLLKNISQNRFKMLKGKLNKHKLITRVYRLLFSVHRQYLLWIEEQKRIEKERKNKANNKIEPDSSKEEKDA